MDFIDGNERRRFAALLIASLFALSGCTDDDDAGDGTSPLAGHWTGSATDASGQVVNATALIDVNGDAQLMVFPPILFLSDAARPVPSAEAPFTSFAPSLTPPPPYIGGTTTSIFAMRTDVCCDADFSSDAQVHPLGQPTPLSGQIEGRLSSGMLVGTFSYEGRQHSFSLAPATGYSQGVTLQDLAGVYSAPGFSFVGGEPSVAYTVAINNDGAITGTYYNGCSYNGNVTIPDTSRNLFRVRVRLENCVTPGVGARDGDYEGLGYMRRDTMIATNPTELRDAFFTSLIGPVWLGSQAAFK